MNARKSYLRGSWQERLWSGIKINKNNSCWEWIGSRFKKMGYGRFLISPNKISSTHRAAYKSVFGEISQNVCVLHKCDNPPCCRPSHLFLGTKETNNKDRNNKGRTAFGDRSGRTKLKEGEVVEILKISKFYPQCKIRKAYKIPKGTIHAIISRKSWKYITLAAR